MTKQSAGRPATALSPHLSLRQAVRPLIFAHALLCRERERAGELAAECDRMLQLTRKLLADAALVHLLVPGDNGGAADGDGSRQAQLIAAYANAGIMWAQVVGCAMALADTLIAHERWDDVRRLAGFLEAAEEITAAQDLRTRTDAAVRRASEARLARINAKMSEDEIASAIEALEEIKDGNVISFYIHDVALAMLTILPSSWRKNYDALIPKEYSYTISWRVKAGERVMAQQHIGGLTYGTDPRSQPVGSPVGLPLPFPAVIVELLVREGQKISGPTPIASVIEIPGPIAGEVNLAQRGPGLLASRLATLARVFGQIQAENHRGRSATEPPRP